MRGPRSPQSLCEQASLGVSEGLRPSRDKHLVACPAPRGPPVTPSSLQLKPSSPKTSPVNRLSAFDETLGTLDASLRPGLGVSRASLFGAA